MMLVQADGRRFIAAYRLLRSRPMDGIMKPAARGGQSAPQAMSGSRTAAVVVAIQKRLMPLSTHPIHEVGRGRGSQDSQDSQDSRITQPLQNFPDMSGQPSIRKSITHSGLPFGKSTHMAYQGTWPGATAALT